MTAGDFRRIALALNGVEEKAHMGAADFRVGGRIFATLAAEERGYGNLMLTPELQAEFVADRPDIFLPVHGGWGRMGATHLRLAEADEDAMAGALHTAWRHRIQLNEVAAKKKTKPRRKGSEAL